MFDVLGCTSVWGWYKTETPVDFGAFGIFLCRGDFFGIFGFGVLILTSGYLVLVLAVLSVLGSYCGCLLALIWIRLFGICDCCGAEFL